MRIVLDNTDNAPRPSTPPGSPNGGKQRNAYLIDPNARRGSKDSARRTSGDSREPRASLDSKDIPRGSMDSRDSNDGHDGREIKLPVSRDHTELREGRDRRDKERGASSRVNAKPNKLPKSLLHN